MEYTTHQLLHHVMALRGFAWDFLWTNSCHSERCVCWHKRSFVTKQKNVRCICSADALWRYQFTKFILSSRSVIQNLWTTVVLCYVDTDVPYFHLAVFLSDVTLHFATIKIFFSGMHAHTHARMRLYLICTYVHTYVRDITFLSL